jgi:aldehyde dehydrogenase (NAD+)
VAERDLYERRDLFIGGEWVAPADGGRVDVISPSSEEVIGFSPVAGRADVDRAVAAARAAIDDGPWPRTSPEERAAALDRMAAHLTERARELATLNVEEAAVPVTYAHARELGPAFIVGFFARLAREFAFREVRQGAAAPAIIVREPVGVVASIVPFNGPLMSAAAKFGPALASGCALVFKPALETPLDAFVLAEAAQEAGIPPGVVNVLPADRAVAEALVGHAGVDRVVFTGSTAGGRAVAQATAGSFKRVTLEMGGKAAAILLDDAPVDASIASILPMSFFNSGQACIALSRLVVPRNKLAAVTEAVAAFTDTMVLGDPHDPATILGPVISAAHRDRIEGMVDMAKADGARVVRGGSRPADLPQGWYVAPTVLTDLGPDARIAQQEVFGPVLVILPHDGDDDAVAIANGTPFGLSGAVFTPDLDRALSLAGRIKVGTFGINGYALDPTVPFGGCKQSGVGREFGVEGLAEYTEIKAVALPAGASVPA